MQRQKTYSGHFSVYWPATLVAIFSMFLFGFIFARSHITYAAAGVNEQINYQGRLLTGAGAVVPDGSYNIEFKIYQDGDGVLGGGDETLKWTESRTGGNKVVVKNGYFSVYLGAVNPFSSSVDWNQDSLWLSINIGGSGAVSWDGEMSPYTRFSSTPYAINTKYFNGLQSSDFLQLAKGVQTDTSAVYSSLFINKTGATANILQLQKAGSDVFVVANDGGVTASGNVALNSNSTFGDAATDGLTFNGEILGASPLRFEGTTNNNIYTTFAFTDPTSSRTITFPDASGAVILDTQFSGDATVTSAGVVTISANAIGASEITNNTLTTSDLSASAGIVNGQLANSSINLALGTSGTDINWGASSVSLGGTATLNLPDASASNRGLVTNGIQTLAGAKTFSSAIAANGGITFDNSSDTLGAFTLAGTQDANNNLILNIGNAGTDFTAGGGLTLAGALTANGGLSVLPTSAGTIGLTVSGRTGQTADLFRIVDEWGDNLLTVNPNVGFSIKSSDGFTSTNAFSVVRVDGGETIIVGVNTSTPGLYTASTSFDLLNTTATTINFGGAATTFNIGPGGASATTLNLAGGSGATGCTVAGTTGNLACSGAITTPGTIGTAATTAFTGSTATFTGDINLPGGGTISLFNCCGSSTWINMPTTGPSGIGSGGAGANPWIAYTAGAGQWFSNSAAGDIVYRNTSGNLLFGNSGGAYQMAISSAGTIFDTDVYSNNNLDINTITGGGLADCDSSGSKLLWNSSTSQFSCGTDRASSQVRKAANEAITSSAALQDDNELFISAGANETWIFQVNYTYTTAGSATPDIRVGMNAPAGSTCVYGVADQARSGGDLAAGATACDATIAIASAATGTKAGILTGTITTAGTAGNIMFRWGQNTSSINATTVVAGSSIIGYKVTGADYAETYYSKDFSIEPGMIVQMDGSGQSQVVKSDKPYSDRQIGIVSTKPGQVLSEADGKGKVLPIAMSGRVPVKISTENGLPKAGDMITASSNKPGYGMRATDSGYVVGQLMIDAKDNGDGTAEGFVYVRHGYWQSQITVDLESVFSTEEPYQISDIDISAVSGNGLSIESQNGLTQAAIDQILKGFKIQNTKIGLLDSRLDELELSINQNSDEGLDDDQQNAVGPTAGLEINLESVEFESVTVSLNLEVGGDIKANGGLTVTGLTTLNGKSVFNDLANFMDNVIFSKDVEFQGRASFNSDTGGFAVIEPGQTEVKIKFDQPYKDVPTVNVTVKNGQFANFAYKDLDSEGFTIVVKEQADTKIEFSWTALDVKDAKTITSSEDQPDGNNEN